MLYAAHAHVDRWDINHTVGILTFTWDNFSESYETLLPSLSE